MDRVVPLYISTGNAVASTGQSWRWCRDTALALGVELVGHGRKRLIPADAFRAVLEGQTDPPSADVGSTDPAAALRERLGLRVVGGAR